MRKTSHFRRDSGFLKWYPLRETGLKTSRVHVNTSGKYYIAYRQNFKKILFKILKGNMPPYLKSLFSVCATEYNFRNIKLNLPKPRTNCLKRSLCYNGALLWNSLPQEVRNTQFFSQFKKATEDCFTNVNNIDSLTAIL